MATPASTQEALEMVLDGLSYLAAADPTALAAQAQAECLQTLEQAGAVATAAPALILAAFTAGHAYSADADGLHLIVDAIISAAPSPSKNRH